MKTIIFITLLFFAGLCTEKGQKTLYIESVNDMPSNDSIIITTDSMFYYLDGIKYSYLIYNRQHNKITLKNELYDYNLHIKRNKAALVFPNNTAYVFKLRNK